MRILVQLRRMAAERGDLRVSRNFKKIIFYKTFCLFYTLFPSKHGQKVYRAQKTGIAGSHRKALEVQV